MTPRGGRRQWYGLPYAVGTVTGLGGTRPAFGSNVKVTSTASAGTGLGTRMVAACSSFRS